MAENDRTEPGGTGGTDAAANAGQSSPGYTPYPPRYPPPGFLPPGYSPQEYPWSEYPPPGYVPGYPPPGYPPPGYPPPGYVPPYPPGPWWPTAWPGSPAESGWPAAPGWPAFPPGSVPWSFPTAPAGPAPGVVWAGVAARLGALIIDLLVLAVALLAAGILANALGTTTVDARTEYSPASLAVSWLWLLCSFLYVPVCWWRFGGTIGQRALGLRVVREIDGRPLRLGAVVMRYVVWFVLLLMVVPAIVTAIAAGAEPGRRAWHDEASGSVVIKLLR